MKNPSGSANGVWAGMARLACAGALIVSAGGCSTLEGQGGEGVKSRAETAGAADMTAVAEVAAAAGVMGGRVDDGEASRAFLRTYAETNRFQHGRPKAIMVTPEGDAVLFLRSGPRSFVQDLYSFDCATGNERVLLTAEQILAGEKEVLTAEELARRERMRMSSKGIASFVLSKDGKRILVPLSGRLFVVERATATSRELKSENGFPIDPQWSPDGASIACVRSGEVWVTDVESGREVKVTSGAAGSVTNGLAEFVAQEEMSRFHGYWWSPDSKTILYQQTDTKGMETFYIADAMNPGKEPDSWPYPRAGKKNADVKLGFVSASGGGETKWVTWYREQYPYVATVSWSEGAPPYIMVQNRTQTTQALLRVNPQTGACIEILGERDAAWMNIYESCPKWLGKGAGFVWVTDEVLDKTAVGTAGAGDYPRLEVYDAKGQKKLVATPKQFPLMDVLSVDDEGKYAVVSASPDGVRTQVWKLAIDGSGGDPVRLSGGTPGASDDGQYGAAFGKSDSVFVESSARVDGTMAWTVKNVEGRVLGSIKSVAERPKELPRIELMSVKAGADGSEFRCVVIKPRDFDPSKKYPVVNQVYGGPISNVVNAAGMGYVLHQWLADRGFIVVSIDNRGTPRRGRAWERSIKNNLIDGPLQDQCDALAALGAKVPQMDLKRVGISGWSFGGYFSAMAAMRRPDVFACGIAGAPVCAWEDYDTHYTERYMGLPEKNPEGYKAANVLTYCKDLTVPLLLIHGTADDNVYFMHALKMSNAMFRAQRSFEFLPLAGFTHMVPEPEVTTALQTRMEQFLKKSLGGPEAR